MKLLAFSLRLNETVAGSLAVQRLPFLGGLLHGAWEHQVRCHAPGLSGLLGLERGKPGPKAYAILPPPFVQPSRPAAIGPVLAFGVLLYADAAAHAEELARAFEHCRCLSVGRWVDPVVSITHQVHVPVYAASFAACSAIRLHWLTPLLLDSPAQRRLGLHQAPPSLLRVVRSLVRRIDELEPGLALQLGLRDAAWTCAEESIRGVSAVAVDWQPVVWRYGSRTKEAPVQFSGQLGRIDYSGEIPSAIHALLHWGTWFGVGQRTALGQGFYQIEGDS